MPAPASAIAVGVGVAARALFRTAIGKRVTQQMSLGMQEGLHNASFSKVNISNRSLYRTAIGAVSINQGAKSAQDRARIRKRDQIGI